GGVCDGLDCYRRRVGGSGNDSIESSVAHRRYARAGAEAGSDVGVRRVMPRLPRIAVIGCGGTIASVSPSSLDVLDYPEFGSKLPIEDVLQRFPETRLVADPLPVSFRNVSSSAIGFEEWRELRALLHRLAQEEPDIQGFVIGHGTGSLEET